MKVLKFLGLMITALGGVCAASQGKDSSFFYPATTGTPFDYSKLKDLIVFGDSYSDVSTDYNTLKYTGNNMSGGKNWPLYLAEDVHKMNLWNFAYSGAVVDLSLVNSFMQVPAMTKQYEYFLNKMAPGKTYSSWKGDTTLFAIWFGINDLGSKNRNAGLTSSQIDEKIMDSMFKMVEGMYTNGARHFVFFYVPAVDKCPIYLNNAQMASDIPNYNKALKTRAKKFSDSHSDVNVFVYDSYSEFIYIMENKSKYGFTNLNSYCQNLNNWRNSGCLEPKNYFWADMIHPLYEVHKIMANDLDALFESNSKAVATTTTNIKTSTTKTVTPTPGSCWAIKLGYKCCSINNIDVVYNDSDGDWGIENNEWCGISDSANKCWSEPLGFPCCTSSCPLVYFTDNDGEWGVENNNWCGISPSCSGSGNSCWSTGFGYECCNGCDIQYTDGDGDWGFENDNWCGIKDSCKSTSSTETTKTTTKSTTTKAPTPTKKCSCQYEPCGPDTCCAAGLSCKETDGWSMCEPDPNAELRPATDCEVGPHYEIWCEGCLITDTQTDGSLWGWENKHPCEIKPYECYDFIHADWSNEDHHWPVGEAKGSTTRYWDCCKPSCAWPGKFDYKTNVKLCAADGSYIYDNNLVSGCEKGPTYACEEQIPWAVDEITAYGFAAANVPGLTEADWCCTCYALTFTSFPIKGKQMVVQVTNTGGDLGEGHFDIQIPGGGFGLFNGCSPRYPEIPEEDWGDRNGGVISREGCYKLPPGMVDGCLWKFDWFRGADNPDITYVKVDCPQELIDLSGCTRMNP